MILFSLINVWNKQLLKQLSPTKCLMRLKHLPGEREAKVETQKEKRLALRNGVDTDSLDSEAQELEEEVVGFLVNEEITNVDWDDDHSRLWKKSDYTFWLSIKHLLEGRLDECNSIGLWKQEFCSFSSFFSHACFAWNNSVKVVSFQANSTNTCGRSRRMEILAT